MDTLSRWKWASGFFKPLPRISRHSKWWLSLGCWISESPGCAPHTHRSSLQPTHSELSTPGRYPRYSTWAKWKPCTCPVWLMYPGPQIMPHTCAFCFQGAEGEKLSQHKKSTSKNVISSGSESFYVWLTEFQQCVLVFCAFSLCICSLFTIWDL